MLPGGSVEINDADAGAGLQSRDEIVKEREGLLNLMIHVHKDRGIEGIRWQPRIVRITEA
jgi:hypothetical protein